MKNYWVTNRESLKAAVADTVKKWWELDHKIDLDGRQIEFCIRRATKILRTSQKKYNTSNVIYGASLYASLIFWQVRMKFLSDLSDLESANLNLQKAGVDLDKWKFKYRPPRM